MVNISIQNGPNFQIAWQSGINVQQALEAGFRAAPAGSFTYALQYYGTMGYLVSMINETYETYTSTSNPFYFWEFTVNGQVSQTGIDNTILNDGDAVVFLFINYTSSLPAASTLHTKFKAKTSN